MPQKPYPQTERTLEELSIEELLAIQLDCSAEVLYAIQEELRKREPGSGTGASRHSLERLTRWMRARTEPICFRIDEGGWIVEPPFAYLRLLQVLYTPGSARDAEPVPTPVRERPRRVSAAS